MKCIVNGKIVLRDGLLEGKALLFDNILSLIHI